MSKYKGEKLFSLDKDNDVISVEPVDVATEYLQTLIVASKTNPATRKALLELAKYLDTLMKQDSLDEEVQGWLK